MKSFDEFSITITVTGINHYPNAKRLLEGDKVILCCDMDNEFDSSAIAVYSEFGKIGYVANSKSTVRKDTVCAADLVELIEDTATAIVTEGGYYEAVCRLDGVYDTDKIILEACRLYNEGEYTEATSLFLKICEKYDSLLLMQYTADCLIKTERYNDALRFAQRAVELEENNKISLMMYATVLQKLERYNEAIEIYNKIPNASQTMAVKDALVECIRLSKNEKR